MADKSLREMMTELIKNDEEKDYAYQRGDVMAYAYVHYVDWLHSLTNEEFLDAYNRVHDLA